MDMSRRFFLYGSGALLTAGFARQAARYSERTGSSLLIPPNVVEGELILDSRGYFFLGDWQDVMPPTWREWFDDHAHWSSPAAEGIDEDELEDPMYDYLWDDHYGMSLAPNAQAYHYLRDLQLGADKQPGSRFGWPEGITFIEGFHPGNSSLFVQAKDPVTVALLQARLIELNSGLKIVERDGEWGGGDYELCP